MEQFTAGIARVDITPQRPLIMDGFYSREGPSLGTHDALGLTALVFTCGHDRAVIMAGDVLGFPPDLAHRIRTELAARFQLPAETVLLAASHTHSGPALGNLLFLDADADYLDWLVQRAAAVVGEALERREPVRLLVGRAQSDVGVNRRLVDADTGLVLMEDNPAGVVDREITSLRLVNGEGTTVGGVVNVGCHPTAILHDGRHFSRDYPGFFLDELERDYPGSLFLFLSGAHANVRPAGSGSRSGVGFAEEIGRQLFEDFRQTRWQEVTGPPSLRVACELLGVEFQELPPDAVLAQLEAACEQALARDPAWGEDLWNKCSLTWVRWVREMHRKDERPGPLEVELQVITLAGSVTMVGLPFELFAQTSLGLKASCGRETQLFVCGYTGGVVGYLPPAEDQLQGGYEAEEAFKVYGCAAPFELGTEALVRHKAEALILKSLRSED